MKNGILILLLILSSFTFSQQKETFTYAVKKSESLKLDIYTPENIQPNDRLPVLLWMHGGGFSGGNRANIYHDGKLARLATEKGYIGVSISYRLLRKGEKTGFGCDCSRQDKLETFKQAAVDYLDAAKFLIDNEEKFHIDSSKIIAGGSSAGAEGILNAVFMKEYFVDDLQKYKNIKFAGVFSMAGAVVNKDYITENNAVPSVFFHGTKDNLVPFATAPHHYCSPEKPGYIMLNGPETIVKKLEGLETSYYLHQVVGGMHEISSIPFEELDRVFDFFNQTVINGKTIQIKKTVFKNK